MGNQLIKRFQIAIGTGNRAVVWAAHLMRQAPFFLGMFALSQAGLSILLAPPNFKISVDDMAKIKEGMTMDQVRDKIGISSYPMQSTKSVDIIVGLWEAKDGFLMIVFDKNEKVVNTNGKKEGRMESLDRRIRWRIGK